MLRLLKWAVALGAVAAVIAFVPLGGQSIRDRWRSARSPAQFVERALSEIDAAWQGKPSAAPTHPPRAPTRASGRASSTRPQPNRSARAPSGPPTEQHTQADRTALDRVLAEHVGPPTP